MPEFSGPLVGRFWIPQSDGTARAFGHAEGDGRHLLYLADRVRAVSLVLWSMDNRYRQEFSRSKPGSGCVWTPVLSERFSPETS
jgi:hypothetical protein